MRLGYRGVVERKAVFRTFQREIRAASGLLRALAGTVDTVNAPFPRDDIMHESGPGNASAGHRSARSTESIASMKLYDRVWKDNFMTHYAITLLDRYFYLGMSLLVAAVVFFGFSRTIDGNLLHPDTPRPLILFIHAIVFSSWLALFIAQSTLIRVSKFPLHRRLGIFGAALGAVLPVLGLTTALVMQRWHAQHGDANEAGLSLPFNDMVTFSITFGLAIRWRRRPDFHRRLMLLATCCLTGAAFARFPESMVPSYMFYVGVDLLILLGVLRDVLINRNVHAVYRYGLPCMAASQAIAVYLLIVAPPLWLTITHTIVQWTA
jgi:hypothetical protein